MADASKTTDVLMRAKAQIERGAREAREAGERTIRRGLMPEMVAEIERLQTVLDGLVGLDVTAREGQRAFAEWRNAYQQQRARA